MRRMGSNATRLNPCHSFCRLMVTLAVTSATGATSVASAAPDLAGASAAAGATHLQNALLVLTGVSVATAPAATRSEDDPQGPDDRRAGRRWGRPERRPDEPGPPGAPEYRPGDRPALHPTPEQLDRVLEFMEEYFPDQFDRLEELKLRHADLFRQRVRRMAPRIFELIHTMEQDPELGELMAREYRLEAEIRELARRYRGSKDADFKNQARQELRQLIEANFDVQVQRQYMQIERLEQRIVRQRQRLEREAEHRDSVIIRRVNRLLAERPAEDTPPEQE